ncbi:UDP-N-acetylenolpyruvoylglucosamine reductase [Helicobacter pylori PZ5026]|uniref:UDP-N-acetylmuramate dehydrogenase n=1 Tax=Helicobacter pylori TaxID=210 RepID=UPI00038D8404|nr:UDP-N-acetylmuramate dehydrogenase [Helicobacter pylori]EQD90603.1 UDP-N-acetylenolpyruvoylglucosamine reductase [Helicobacter pylori PZ5026]MBM0606076.1 UDP-N-acetylmuramate dehydrogenase [Helicobacter pylori]MBM0613408.1 UDP-N-acetylmuramate dehydrogenase [Helicobacter pylori]WQU31832.1 UDP-N-acetylmuramate dehydrogenase [Helicobacter pylori]
MLEKTIDFSRYSSVKIGTPLKVSVLENDDEISQEHQIIGLANNLLIAPGVKNLALLGKNYDYICDHGECIEIGGAANASKIFNYFRVHDLGGLEFLGQLPGTLGALVKMNAGMKEFEIKNVLESAYINNQWLGRGALGLDYRSSKFNGVVLRARFKKTHGFRQEVLKACQSMRKSHPKLPNFGSCFKNPPNDHAGRLLEGAGLRGYCLKRVGFAREHANFLVNLGGAEFEEALDLIELAKTRVLQEYGIHLEEEVKILR